MFTFRSAEWSLTIGLSNDTNQSTGLNLPPECQRVKVRTSLILGTFWDVPGRILHFCLRLQSVCEVVLGCNWRCRRLDMSAV